MSRSSIIAREGLLPIVVSVLAAVLVMQTLGLAQSLIFWLIALVLLLIFRDPVREIPAILKQKLNRNPPQCRNRKSTRRVNLKH